MADKKDINEATTEDLKERMGGMGDETAHSILDYRDENSPIQDMDEFKNIEGIGDSTIEELKMNFYAGESVEEEEIVEEEKDSESENISNENEDDEDETIF